MAALIWSIGDDLQVWAAIFYTKIQICASKRLFDRSALFIVIHTSNIVVSAFACCQSFDATSEGQWGAPRDECILAPD